MQSFFAIKRIRLIWLDILIEWVNREEKTHADWMNQHIFEEMNRERQNCQFQAY